MSPNIWESPDGIITKEIIHKGVVGVKPTENCKCFIMVTNNSAEELQKIVQSNPYVIGESDTIIQRCLDNCLLFMHAGEISNVSLKLETTYKFTLELVNFETEDLIYNWNTQKKLSLSFNHKSRGVELFKESRYVDASYRFGKGLKILCSIPIEVDQTISEIEGVSLTEIDNLKVNLYNNLASCYLKCHDYQTVLDLCHKIFEIDRCNVKALYKQGVASSELQDYEKSHNSFSSLLEIDPENKAAIDKLKCVNIKMNESNLRVNAMIKKMFNK